MSISSTSNLITQQKNPFIRIESKKANRCKTFSFLCKILAEPSSSCCSLLYRPVPTICLSRRSQLWKKTLGGSLKGMFSLYLFWMPLLSILYMFFGNNEMIKLSHKLLLNKILRFKAFWKTFLIIFCNKLKFATRDKRFAVL